MERRVVGVMGEKTQNQSGPNLIFSPAGFARTRGGRAGAASVLQPSVCVHGCVCLEIVCVCMLLLSLGYGPSAFCTNLIVVSNCCMSVWACVCL